MTEVNLARSARCLALGLTITGFAFLGQTSFAAPPGSTPFGVYDPGGEFTDDSQVQIEHLFLPWEDVSLDSLYDADEYASDRGRSLLVTIEPWTWTRDARNTPEILINSINTGAYDENMRSICNVLNDLKSPITVRWAQEMEEKKGQFIWSNWEPTVYINAYKRIIDVCRSEAPNIKVMWSPLGNADAENYYPGDDYVDTIGLSVFGLQAYDEFTTGKEQSFQDIFGPRYANVEKFCKPIIVAELGFVGDVNYVQNWQNTVAQNYNEYPYLKGIVYFNQKEVHAWPSGFGKPDWRISKRVVE